MAAGYDRAVRVRIFAATALAICGMTLGACGDSDEEEIRAIAAQYLRATADGDPVACRLISADELARVELLIQRQEAGASCEQVIVERELAFGAPQRQALAGRIGEADVVERGGNAVLFLPSLGAEGSPAGEGAPFALSLVHESGAWRIDDEN